MNATAPRPERSAGIAELFRGRRAILFDLDGTLYGGPAYEAYLRHADDVTGLRIRGRTGVADPAGAFAALEALREGDPSLRSKSDVLERRFGISLAEMNRFRERFTEIEAHFRPDPRAARLLNGLRTRYRLLLGTNNAPRLARRILAALGVDPNVFVGVLTSEDAGAAKPDARFFHEAARRLGVAPGEFVSVGDRPESDLAPAVALGAGAWRVDGPDDLYALETLLEADLS
jgi:FMN phosphatase YigB (HAD superfamily)